MHLANAEDTIPVLTTFVAEVLGMLVGLEDKEAHAPGKATATVATFPLYYGAVFEAACSLFVALPCKKDMSGTAALRTLSTAAEIAKVIYDCLQLTKKATDRAVLIATLKHAKPYVECVQKKWMAFLGTAICTHTDEVARFLKHFQNSTRQIQNICAHGKVVRDSMMMKFVPALKRGMEAVIYAYKGILADNHLLETFWIGNLKNRSLDGKEVASQMPFSDEGDEDEEGAEDDAE